VGRGGLIQPGAQSMIPPMRGAWAIVLLLAVLAGASAWGPATGPARGCQCASAGEESDAEGTCCCSDVGGAEPEGQSGTSASKPEDERASNGCQCCVEQRRGGADPAWMVTGVVPIVVLGAARPVKPVLAACAATRQKGHVPVRAAGGVRVQARLCCWRT